MLLCKEDLLRVHNHHCLEPYLSIRYFVFSNPYFENFKSGRHASTNSCLSVSTYFRDSQGETSSTYFITSHCNSNGSKLIRVSGTSRTACFHHSGCCGATFAVEIIVILGSTRNSSMVLRCPGRVGLVREKDPNLCCTVFGNVTSRPGVAVIFPSSCTLYSLVT